MKYENIDQYLEMNLTKGKKEKPSKLKKSNSKKKKGIAVVIIAGVLAITTGITGLIHFGKKKNTTSDKIPAKTVEATTPISTLDLSDLGNDLPSKTKEEQQKEKYGKTTGDVDVNKIVEKNGVYYVDQKSADKSSDIGKKKTNTKNNKYVVDKNGTVKEKEVVYEIKDSKTGKTSTVKDSNKDGIPDGYEYNKELNGTYKESDNTELYTVCDANYYGYNQKGEYTLMFKKGDIVLKETLKKIKKDFSTSKTPKTEVPTKKEETTKTDTPTKKEETTKTDTPSKKEETTKTDTPTKKEETTSSVNVDKGVVNADGTYTIYGMTFESKADYEQWIIQGYEGYVEADGIMVSEDTINKEYQKIK